MAYGGIPSFHDCTKLRIETVKSTEYCWYRIYADGCEIAIIHGAVRGKLPMVALDTPSRLIISGDAS